MAGVELCDPSLNAVYQELLKEFPLAAPRAVEASLQFMRVAANIHVKMESLFSEYSLTSGRFALLMMLRHEASRQISPSEMAKRAQVSRATMTQFLDSLEKDRFIVRVDDPHDRRSMSIRLTPAGESVLAQVLPKHIEHLEQTTESLSRTELKQLYNLMSKLIRE
jgi:DNA-binding MarR family transcriptional regulator